MNGTEHHSLTPKISIKCSRPPDSSGFYRILSFINTHSYYTMKRVCASEFPGWGGLPWSALIRQLTTFGRLLTTGEYLNSFMLTDGHRLFQTNYDVAISPARLV